MRIKACRRARTCHCLLRCILFLLTDPLPLPLSVLTSLRSLQLCTQPPTSLSRPLPSPSTGAYILSVSVSECGWITRTVARRTSASEGWFTQRSSASRATHTAPSRGRFRQHLQLIFTSVVARSCLQRGCVGGLGTRHDETLPERQLGSCSSAAPAPQPRQPSILLRYHCTLSATN